jgi:hypothetical protein
MMNATRPTARATAKMKVTPRMVSKENTALKLTRSRPTSSWSCWLTGGITTSRGTPRSWETVMNS